MALKSALMLCSRCVPLHLIADIVYRLEDVVEAEVG